MGHGVRVARIDEDAIKSAYRRWAPALRHTFGRVAAEGRKHAVEAINGSTGRVLEVGVGTGLSLPAYARHLEIVGIDLSPEMLEKARERVAQERLTNVTALREMDAGELDFEDAAFDTVVAMYVMTVVPDPEKVMRELSRVCIEPYLNEVAAAVNHRTGAPIAASTARQRIQAVGSFLDAIAEWGWPEAPARRLIFPRDAPKLPHPLPRYLPPDQERALLTALEDSPNRLRADALLLMRATGMRIGELTMLELDCVHEVPGSGAWLKVPLGKLLTERMVPIDEETVEIIDRITGHRSRAGRCAIPAPGRWPTSCSPTRAAGSRPRPSARNCTAPPPKPAWTALFPICSGTPTPPPWSTPAARCRP